MKTLIFVFVMWVSLISNVQAATPSVVGEAEQILNKNHIYLNLSKKAVCSNRVSKCWPVALGNKANPTPYVKGPHYVTIKKTKGFIWQNPFTKQIFPAGTHNLGNIWIGIVKQSNGIEVGFHTTPTPNIPLNEQSSLGGCVRMTAKDILEFSNNVNYLDEIYIVK